jgi:hypothetical protein
MRPVTFGTGGDSWDSFLFPKGDRSSGAGAVVNSHHVPREIKLFKLSQIVWDSGTVGTVASPHPVSGRKTARIRSITDQRLDISNG